MIYSTDDVDLISAALSIRSGQTATLSIKADCEAGWQLISQSVTDLTVEAKHSASGSYTNIEGTGLPLDAWDGTVQTFNIRLTAGTVTTHLRKAFGITVAKA